MDYREWDRQAVEWIGRFRAGEDEAFRCLVETYSSAVMRLVSRLAFSHHDRQDMLNEIWLKVARQLHRYDPSRPFHSWLFAVAVRTAIDYSRKRKRQLQRERLLSEEEMADVSSDAEWEPEQQLIGKEAWRQMRALFQQLEERERLLLKFRFEDQMSYEEIGQLMGMNKNTVGTRIHRARQKLREGMKKWGQEGKHAHP